MLPYAKQLEYKQQQVRDNLSRIGKITLPDIFPIIGADKTKYYRNKIEYTFNNKRFLQTHELSNPSISALKDVAGYHAKGFFDKVVDIQTCYLQGEPTNSLRKAVKQFAIANQFSFYDIRKHEGFMRNLQIRL
jgi:23S rRNA (uracil1939-C5)-methyltransferase